MECAEAWLQRLKAVECRDATFPSADPAVVFATADGSIIHSVDGRHYIDLCAGFGALPLGHNSVPMRSAFAARIEAGPVALTHGMGDVFASRVKIELLETLVSHLPSHLTRAALALSGSQAVELAMKTAMLRTGHHGFIVFEHGYHGVELGVLPLTARADFREPFAGWSRPAAVIRLPFGCAPGLIEGAVRRLQQTPGIGFAGICLEPLQGRAGIRLIGEEWLSAVHSLCHASAGLLIFDEVFVGLGRTGKMSFSSLVPADLICLGKALGGGMPLSACVGTEDAMQAWPESAGEAIHTGTFFGHPLSCEIGLSTLRTLVEDNWLTHVKEHGVYWLSNLRDRYLNHPDVIEVRGQGFMWGIEFSRPGMGASLADKLRQRGVLALPSGGHGEVLSLTPAFNIPAATLTEALDQLSDALS